ncbi:hypothetical protein KIPB_014261, partial [Kipferlia bialata]
FVVVTGDLSNSYGLQDQTQWDLYNECLAESALLDPSFWVDMAGNHDSYGVESTSDETNLFCSMSATSQREGHCVTHLDDTPYDTDTMHQGSVSSSSSVSTLTLNDYDTLRSDSSVPPMSHPLYRLAAGKIPDGDTVT